MNTTPKCSEEVMQERMRTAITKLVVECPVVRKNPAVCPLNAVRKKRMPARVQWIVSLPDDDIEFLSDYHQICEKWQKAGCP